MSSRVPRKEKLILASQSPRRIALLRQVGLAFEVFPSSGPEPEPEPGEEPSQYAIRTARYKGHQVQRTLDQPEAWILSADTVVVLDPQEILGKPCSEADAKRMLSALQDDEHTVITAFVLANQSQGIEHEEAVHTKVRFRRLSPLKIQRYIHTGEPMDKAGAYGIQGRGAAFVEGIEGCYFNVVGLPIGHVIAALEHHEADLF